eukprot:SAG31_NODE_1789_length_7236_cov_7.210607_11_plen_68_part_00
MMSTPLAKFRYLYSPVSRTAVRVDIDRYYPEDLVLNLVPSRYILKNMYMPGAVMAEATIIRDYLIIY